MTVRSFRRAWPARMHLPVDVLMQIACAPTTRGSLEAPGARPGLARGLKQICVCPYEVAGVYAQLGAKDRAFQWLDKAY